MCGKRGPGARKRRKDVVSTPRPNRSKGWWGRGRRSGGDGRGKGARREDRGPKPQTRRNGIVPGARPKETVWPALQRCPGGAGDHKPEGGGGDTSLANDVVVVDEPPPD